MVTKTNGACLTVSALGCEQLSKKSRLLVGGSGLLCFALAMPVLATDFIITGSNHSTNGLGTIDGDTEALITDDAINGSDTVSLGIALTTTAEQTVGINTVGGTNNVFVSSSGSIVTNGVLSNGIFNTGNNNTTTVSGSVATNGRISDGILNQGNDNTTTVSGSITTEASSSGIWNMATTTQPLCQEVLPQKPSHPAFERR